MNAEKFIYEISNLSFEDTFNPYLDKCNICDDLNAPVIRRNLLLGILNSASSVEVESIWIGRDLGYRGGRRTGLALTDDLHFFEHAARWGVETTRPTIGKIVPERTAAVIWSALSLISSPIFLWNVFPLHPHIKGYPFTNRTHNLKERIAGEEMLDFLIRFIEPKRIIAIGNDAEMTASKLSRGQKVIKVRHPSYGGQREFLESINNLYNIGI